MAFKHCRHIKEDGFFCQAPALRGRDYCRFHLGALGRRLRMARALARREPYRMVLPLLEDMNAVQVATMQVLDALSAGLLEDKRARLMLYGLRQAALNLRAIKAAPQLAVPAGQGGEGIRAEEYAGFEEEFGLPPDIDLTKPPEVVFPPAAPTVAQQAEPSAYRSNRGQQVTAEDVELQEILATKGQEAYEKRSLQLQAQQWKQIERERRKLDEAHRVVAAARRSGQEFTSARQKAFYEKLQADDAAEQKATVEEIAALRAAMAAELARKSPASAANGDDDAPQAATGSSDH